LGSLLSFCSDPHIKLGGDPPQLNVLQTVPEINEKLKTNQKFQLITGLSHCFFWSIDF